MGECRERNFPVRLGVGRDRAYPDRNRAVNRFEREREDFGVRFRQSRYSGKLRENLNGRYYNLKESSFIFFNFPANWEAVDLWRMFKRYRNCSDIYMAKKKLRNGQRFGFIRFKQAGDSWELERRLSSIWIGNSKLQVFKADSRRKGVVGDGKADRESSDSKARNRMPEFKTNVGGDKKSYAEAVSGAHKRRERPEKDTQSDKSESAPLIEKSLGSWEGDPTHRKFLDKCLVGNVTSVDNIGPILKLCEGVLQGARIKFLGGHQILMYFEDEISRGEVLRNKNHGIHHWVKDISEWSIGYRATERLVWVNIAGVPLHGWKEEIFESIAEIWGKVISTKNCNLLECDNLAGGKVLICTPLIIPIKEYGHVKIGNMFYWVSVAEIEEIDEVVGEEDAKMEEGDGSVEGDSEEEWEDATSESESELGEDCARELSKEGVDRNDVGAPAGMDGSGNDEDDRHQHLVQEIPNNLASNQAEEDKQSTDLIMRNRMKRDEKLTDMQLDQVDLGKQRSGPNNPISAQKVAGLTDVGCSAETNSIKVGLLPNNGFSNEIKGRSDTGGTTIVIETEFSKERNYSALEKQKQRPSEGSNAVEKGLQSVQKSMVDEGIEKATTT
ncbi:LOW QUALITY PROTEIN: hypothetical protein OSB04_031281 [Centaurea solstitialis]|uniref:RRM domain-containing protein n=1 Tax=Centaurea solstitialis TaxID=347529 RepID=A0AA38SGR0_9ASTR|nr:LOW QUALITY PROTEIN: hypothetical protein OSB04_031281 [Centaurea solstitialis]